MPKKPNPALEQLRQEASPSLSHDVAVSRAKAETARLRQQNAQAVERIQALEAQVEFLTGLDPPKPSKRSAKKTKPEGDGAFLIVLGDWHAEEEVDPATISQPNEYNLEIFATRAERAFAKGVRMLHALTRELSQVDEVVVVFLGDLLTGYLHPENQVSNQVGPAEVIGVLRDQMAAGLDYVVREAGVSTVRVAASYGNHGRMTQEKRYGTAWKTSLEYLLYSDMAKRDAARGIPWQIARGYHNVIEVKGHRIRCHHGDAIKYQGGIGGFTVTANRNIWRWNRKDAVEFDLFGHLHQFHRDAKWMSIGSLIGYNAYAEAKGFEWEPPSQGFAVVDRKRGVALAERLFVD